MAEARDSEPGGSSDSGPAGSSGDAGTSEVSSADAVATRVLSQAELKLPAGLQQPSAERSGPGTRVLAAGDSQLPLPTGVTPQHIFDLYDQSEKLGEATASLSGALVETVVQADPIAALGGRVAHYELIRALGAGGMGQVHLARDTRLGRLVALKFLTGHGEDFAQRFLVEARATARVTHDNVVIIYEVGEHASIPFMALEYVEGQTLDEWLDERRHRYLESADPHVEETVETQEELPDGPADQVAEPAEPGPGDNTPTLVPPERAAELMIPVVRALERAHEMGIVHRDLKPANVMLADNGAIKVLDFGIAKLLTHEELSTVTGHWDTRAGLKSMALAGVQSMTRAGTIVGTLPYMSPEQLNGGDIDGRSDLWAVGVMLYQLVVGRHPLAPLSGPKFKQIADVEVPMRAVSEFHSGLGPLGPIIDRCLRKRAADRIASASELLAELEQLVSPHGGRTPTADQGPFVGLSAFQKSDADRFFGREQDVASTAARLRNEPLLAIVGPSGVGKSSFVRAGLIPALDRSGDRWEAFITRPGRHCMAALADVLARASAVSMTGATSEHLQSTEELQASLREQPGILGTQLRARSRHTLRRILLFVDQFEELYTLESDPAERARFARCLEGVADDASSPLRVVLSLRSDFLDRVADDPSDAMRAVIRRLLWLQPIGRAGLSEALTRPVEQAGYRFENEEMVEDMLRALQSTRIPLPVLGFTAARLWDARDCDDKVLTHASYRRLGGVEGALATHADSVLAGLSVRQRQLARTLFVHLVTSDRTRAIVSMSELCRLTDDADALQELVQELAHARLVLIDTDDSEPGGSEGESAGSSVELAHESLIERWPTLAQWLEEDSDDREFRQQLHSAARQWLAKDRPEGLLWRGREALDAKRWWQDQRELGLSGPLGQREEQYLTAVIELADRARRRRRQLVAGAFAAVIAVAVVLSVLAVRADRAADRAEREAERAEHEATRVAEQAQQIEGEAMHARNATRLAAARERQDDPTTALALLREVEPGQVPHGWSALTRQALHASLSRAVLHHPDRVHGAAFAPDGHRLVSTCWDGRIRVWQLGEERPPTVLVGHTGIVDSAVFSPDGRRILSASPDRTVRVWNADGTGEPLILRGHTDEVNGAVFSPDGTRIASASHDRTVRVWNADGTGQPRVLSGHQDAIYTVAFSADGQRVASASFDRTVRVWPVDSDAPPVVLRSHRDRVHGVAFSHAGDILASASYDATVHIWNADGRGQPRVLAGHSDFINSVAFSPDDTRVVSAADDRTARVWDLRRPDSEPLILRGHQRRVITAAFSPDGHQVLTASFDKTVRVWSIEQSAEPRVLRGHDDRVNLASYSPDGRYLATISDDGTTRLWPVARRGPGEVLRGHSDLVQHVAFSPDSRRLVTASKDGTARVWSLDDLQHPVVLRGARATPNWAAPSFSGGGRLLTIADGSPVVAVWRPGDVEPAFLLSGHEGQVHMAVFNRQPGAPRIATASNDGTARLWAVDGTGQSTVLRGHRGDVRAALFSPDGTAVLTHGDDGTVRVWELTGRQLALMDDHDALLERIVFSPDGRWIAAVSSATLWIWPSAGGSATEFTGHEDRIDWVEFSPDGRRLVTVSRDNTARVWSVDGAGTPLVLPAVDEVNSARFSPDGRQLALASDDHTAAIWSDLQPLEPGDPRLWTASDYCMPVARRQKLLGMPSSMATSNRAACLRRVERAATRPGERQP